MAALREENERLAKENGRLLKENEARQQEIARLRERLSEALRAAKRQAAPFSKGAPKANPKRRGRKPGRRYGVRAHRTPPRHIDEIIDVPRPDRCACGGEVDGDVVVAQYQTEIPVKPICRRLDIHFGRCTNCGRRVYGRHPLQTSDAVGAAAAQLGPQAQAMVATLKDEVGVSYGDIEKIFLRGWGIPLTRGGAAQIVLRVGRRLAEPYRGILMVVRRSRVIYPDETGWKVAALLWWMWVFVARTATAFVIRHSRGHDVPEELLGRHWAGTMVHDGWTPYDFFKQAQHQQCLGHIQRRCKVLLETATRGAVRYPRAILELTKDAFALRDRREAGRLSLQGLSIARGRLESRLNRLLQWRLTHAANLKLANHLDAHRDELLVFLKRRGIEATSWPADQAIRPAVANRKVCGGNRDPTGARALERIASVVATCAKRQINVFEYLTQVLCAVPDQRADLACHLLGVPLPT
ncbi:MAG: IS66 family transposase [candidate division NC10 bacterium]|nr:IS66 family transposase [candidate division NC10 bacterium]MBI2457523.1 IS66 family transposase [candidate division NC10 bacterium]